jgi:hypothetical protein
MFYSTVKKQELKNIRFGGDIFWTLRKAHEADTI